MENLFEYIKIEILNDPSKPSRIEGLTNKNKKVPLLHSVPSIRPLLEGPMNLKNFGVTRDYRFNAPPRALGTALGPPLGSRGRR
jgi:hypothetical protein